MIDGQLQRLGTALADEDSRRRLLSRGKGCVRGFLLLLTVAGLLGLLTASLLLKWVGERNLTLAFCLYLPRILFLLPLIGLLPLTLLFHWRLSLALLAAGGLFAHFSMGWQLRGVPAAVHPGSGQTLTVLTYNRGQHQNQSLQPFKDAILPDVIAFQEAGGRANRYTQAEGYEAFRYGADAGEFTLLSRHPILSADLIAVATAESTTTPAARFEIDFSGRPVALYNVHVISPRDTLNYYRRGAFLYGVIGVPGTEWGEKRRLNQLFWDRRIDEARELVRIIAEDPLPTLVVGDFNAPAGGYIHGILLDHLADAHREAGSGFGYSFPGVTRNPLSRGGPWMRIDYLFSDQKHWRTEWCLTEPDRPSQHRAVAAQFRLLETAGAPAPP